VKSTLIFMLAGALAGVVVASYVVPPALSWYSTPGGAPGQTLVQIPEVIRYATSKLIGWQAIASGLGAGLGLVLGVLLAVRGRAPNPSRRPLNSSKSRFDRRTENPAGGRHLHRWARRSVDDSGPSLGPLRVVVAEVLMCS
jgi:hypothetical protein